MMRRNAHPLMILQILGASPELEAVPEEARPLATALLRPAAPEREESGSELEREVEAPRRMGRRDCRDVEPKRTILAITH